MLPQVLLTLFVLCSLCSPTEALGLVDGKDGRFDYVMLVREWPFTFCTVNSCENKNLLQSKFNIHGLWAEDGNTTSNGVPMFCNTTFDYAELTPILDELNQNWMNLKNPNGSAKSFWRQEFVKHGSCVATEARFNTTYLYFSAALQLHKKYNLIDMLAAGGVAPGANQINSSNIRAALRRSFGFEAGVRCYNESGSAYLYELRLCFTKSLEPTNCEDKPESLALQREQLEQREKREQLEQREKREKREQLRGFPWILHRIYEVASRLLRGLRGAAQAKRPRTPATGRAGSSGTYACREGELVLLPAAI